MLVICPIRHAPQATRIRRSTPRHGEGEIACTYSNRSAPGCKPAPRISWPDTIQPLTPEVRAQRIRALRTVLSAPEYQAKVRLLTTKELDQP